MHIQPVCSLWDTYEILFFYHIDLPKLLTTRLNDSIVNYDSDYNTPRAQYIYDYLNCGRRIKEKGGHMSPRLDERTRKRIIELAFPEPGEKPPSATKILEQLQDDNSVGRGYIIPESDRTIHAVIRKARTQQTELMEVDREPWSLAAMDKAGIPWEATHFLLEATIELREKGGELWPETEQLIRDLQEMEVLEKWSPPASGVMTNRRAKWLWRMHLALPTEEVRNIVRRADFYAHREMMAEYLGRDFVTSDFDNGLMNLLRYIKHKEKERTREP